MQQAHSVGVLLDGTRFPQIRHRGPEIPGTIGSRRPVQLAKANYGDVQPHCQQLQGTGVLGRCRIEGQSPLRRRQETQVVHHQKPRFLPEAKGFNLPNTEAGPPIEDDGQPGELGCSLSKVPVLLLGKLPTKHVPGGRAAAQVRHQAGGTILRVHLHADVDDLRSGPGGVQGNLES